MSDLAPVKILIAEDDTAIASTIGDLLIQSGFSCNVTHDGMQALQLAASEEYDLIILDVGLPTLSGLDVCREVKNRSPKTAIMMLTARVDEADVVSGLELGADDYVCKPFKSRELLARVRARLRERTQRLLRSATESQSENAPETPIENQLIDIGEMQIDLLRLTVSMRGERLDLSAREFELIATLASSPGRPFDRDELLDTIWSVSNPAYAPNVSVFISRLRKKIEDDPLNPRYLLTVRGVGYRLVESNEL